MASELITYLSPTDLRAESSIGYETGLSSVKPTGAKVFGMSLQKDTSGNKGSASYTGTFLIPGSLTMATGVTVAVALSDDGTNAADLGKNVRIGVTTKILTANATLDMDAGASLGTEQKATVTLSATSLGVALGTIAVTTANMGTGAAVGALVAIRVRRIGDDPLDTCQGRVLLTGVSVANT